MKQIFKISFIAMLLLALTMPAGAKAPRKSQKSTKTVYYVVWGSYSTLEGAKESMRYIPDGMEAPIYKAKVNGKTYYRHCISCYKSKAEAQKEVDQIKEYYMHDTWIWPSKGLAKCVYCPVALSGERTTPLTPR